MSCASANHFPFVSVSIEDLQTYAQEGTKLALFVGKRPYEKLPYEEGILWISMDAESERIHRENPRFDREQREERFHLRAAFNPENAHRLQGIFEKVVVDRSTYKYFQGEDWEIIRDLSSLLNPSGEGILITEVSKGRVILDDRYYKNCVPLFVRQIKAEAMGEEASAIISNLTRQGTNQPVSRFARQYIDDHRHLLPLFPEVIWKERRVRLAIKEIFKKHFEHVACCIYSPYPYLTRYDISSSGTFPTYFVATKLKRE